MELIIDPKGIIRAVYGETIHLPCLGITEIRRASCVEPDSNGQWTADLAPIGGPILGPFICRSSALDAEINWLHQHWLLPPSERQCCSLHIAGTSPKEYSWEKGSDSY